MDFVSIFHVPEAKDSLTMTEDFSSSSENCSYFRNEKNIRNITLDFGQVPVEATVVKIVKISNESCIEQPYEVHKDPTTNPLDAVFHFNKYSWSLSPNETILLKVSYRPILPSQRNVDYFTIVNFDTTIINLVARGTSIGPNAVVTADKIVMICRPGENIRKRVKIVNDSDVPAIFMFDFDETQSSFKLNPMDGYIAPRTNVHIAISFEPSYEGLSVLFLPCLIKHQSPIIMKLFGYCGAQYTKEKDELKIPTLVYPQQTANGFKSYMDDSSTVKQSNSWLPDPLALSANYFDFGRVNAGPNNLNLRSTKVASFTNSSLNDMTLKWQEDTHGIFNIKPKEALINSGETCLFEIRFDPNESRAFYVKELSALIFWMKNNETVLKYPMIASVRAIGHTFPEGLPDWIPQYQLPRTVIMPPCFPSKPAYTTFLIKKIGNIPLMFSFVPPRETHFTVKPMIGIIYKNHQVIVVEMFPESQNKHIYERWAIIFNGNSDYEAFVDFRGYTDYPSLSFNSDVVNFSSTHPSCEQVKHVSMRNTSRHHITYWFANIPSELTINPVRGLIYSNEITNHDLIFCPIQVDNYAFNVSCCFTSSETAHDESIMEIQLRVTGNSERGFLQAAPSELNFGEVIYDEMENLDLQLNNPSPVDIPYKLMLKYQEWPYEEKMIKEQICIEPASGNLCSGDIELIEVSIRPRHPGFHMISVEYLIEKHCKSIASNESFEICKISYFCVLSTIKIEDLLYHRTGPCTSKYILWRLLNITKLNKILNDLQPGEQRDVEIHLPVMILQEEPSIIKLLIMNPTSAVTIWNFKQIQLCSCSRVTEKRGLSFEYKKYNCPHRNLCKFSPKSGSLKAREKTIVTMELSYAILGETKLKWDLEIGHDRHVYLSIKMTSVSAFDEKAFLLYGSRMELQKIYIGDLDPINQTCWIHNPTQNDISYSLDTTAFLKINQENRIEVFSCAIPSGVIKAETCEPVLIKFQPRRSGIFEVDIPLMLGSERAEIILKGESTIDPVARVFEEFNPLCDTFHVPDIPVYLNADCIILSRASMHSRITKMITIHNRLKDDFIAFKWIRYQISEVIQFDVEPATGRIQPESLKTCQLIVITGKKPCIINANITCEFINQSQNRAYERSVLMHDTLCEEMKYHFTITEKGTTIPKLERLVEKKPKPFYKGLTVSCNIQNLENE